MTLELQPRPRKSSRASSRRTSRVEDCNLSDGLQPSGTITNDVGRGRTLVELSANKMRRSMQAHQFQQSS